MIAAALERAEARYESFDMPELLRTRAQIGIVSGRLDPRAAEAMLRHSIELANSQCGRTEEAHAVLAAVYGCFMEVYETRDFRIAAHLMEAGRPIARAERAWD